MSFEEGKKEVEHQLLLAKDLGNSVGLGSNTQLLATSKRPIRASHSSGLSDAWRRRRGAPVQTTAQANWLGEWTPWHLRCRTLGAVKRPCPPRTGPRIVPSEAKALPLVGYIFAGTWMLMGFERFCYDLADGAPLAARIVDRLGQFAHRIVENVLQYDCVGAVCMPDDMAYTTSLMVKPVFLRRHVFPWDKKIGQLVHGKRLPYCLHSDGRYVPVIDDLIECGFDAIHPCEPASMDMVELKKQYGGRLCLCGNINLDSTLTLGTPDEVEEEVKLRICTIGPGGGYCCGSSNSVTEYVPYANYQAMIGAIKKYGEYSISGFQAGDSRRPLRNSATRGPT